MAGKRPVANLFILTCSNGSSANAGKSMIEASYRRDGFAVSGEIIPPAKLDAVADDIRGVFMRRARTMGLAVPMGDGHDALSQLLLHLFARDRTSYLATARQTQYLASVHRLGLSAPIMRMLGDIGIAVPSQSTRPVIHFMADGLRIGGGGTTRRPLTRIGAACKAASTE